MLAGDIVLFHGRGLVSRIVSLLTSSPGEARTKVTHVALAITDHHIVEVTRRGVFISWRDRGAVYRHRSLNRLQAHIIAQRAQAYIGRPYGYRSVVLAGLDGLLGGPYLFRRLSNMRIPHCAQLVATCYSEAGVHFGEDPKAATPDSIADWISAHPDLFELVP